MRAFKPLRPADTSPISAIAEQRRSLNVTLATSKEEI